MVYVGIDLHKRYSYVVAIDEEGSIISKRKILHVKDEWINYIKSFSTGVYAVVEATINWYFLTEWLEPLVEKLVLANPFKVRVIAEAKIKTDKIDAHMLAQLLRGNLIPESYISSQENREHKNVLRHRISLVRMRTQLKNKVHALLARNAIFCDRVTDIFGKSGKQYLENLSLPRHERWILNELLIMIKAHNEAIQDVDCQIRKQCSSNQYARLIITMPGIGWLLSLLIAAEIGDIKRFPTAKKLCCYAGLAPSVHSSGGRVIMGKLIKQSNKWLSWAMVEAANAAVRHGKIFYSTHKRIKARKGSNIAKVALARHMLTIIYHMLKDGKPFIEEFAMGHPLGELAYN